MNTTLIGVIVLFAAYAVNRFVMTNATKKLDDSMKLKLFEVFSTRNNYATVFLLILILLFFIALQWLPQQIFLITIVYLAVYVSYFIFRFVSNYKKLKQLKMPTEYMKSFIAGYCIFTAGVLGMAFCIFRAWIN